MPQLIFTLRLIIVDALSLDGVDQTDMLLYGKSSKRSEMFYNIDMEPMKLFGQAAVRWVYVKEKERNSIDS